MLLLFPPFSSYHQQTNPNLQWLPNQLSAVMELMVSIYDTYLSPTADATKAVTNGKTPQDLYNPQVEEMMRQVRDQKDKLAKEVEKWCAERGVASN